MVSTGHNSMVANHTHNSQQSTELGGSIMSEKLQQSTVLEYFPQQCEGG